MRVFDGHCDTIYACCKQNASLVRENPDGHLDLKRIQIFDAYAQFFAIFEDARGRTGRDMEAMFDRQYGVFLQELEENRPFLRFCRTAQDAKWAFGQGKAAAFLSVEGADLLDCNLESLERAYRLGIRAVNLTWNRANALSGTAVEEPARGLSPRGALFARRMQELGMLVDVSHLSDPGFWDVMELAKKPVFASHSNARSVWNHKRNLTDEQFCALIKNGGVAGLNFYANFLGEDPDLDTIASHLEHFWALGGEDHVSLGGDWDGCDTLPKGMEAGVGGLPKLYEHLLRKNYSETLLDKLFYQNLMRVVEIVCTM